jgi:hypothetical protein
MRLSPAKEPRVGVGLNPEGANQEAECKGFDDVGAPSYNAGFYPARDPKIRC